MTFFSLPIKTMPRSRGVTASVIFVILLGFAPPVFAQEEPRLVTPNDQTAGSLLLESEIEGKYIAAPAIVTDIEIDISGPIARTKVTQRFENTSDSWVEGVYVFPLPDESAVDALRLQIGDRFIEGQIKEREQARLIYETARTEGRKASLIEQERANIFTNSVANIGPGETVVIQIEFQETIQITDGRFSLRFPMVVGPRYNPIPQLLTASIDETTGWATFDPVPDRERITPAYNDPDVGLTNPVRLSVDIDAGFPIGTLASSFHAMSTAWDGTNRATLTLQDENVPANRDFELVWSPKAGGSPRAALFSEAINEEDYFLLMITPPDSDTVTAVPAREVTFIIDTSGSMGGESIRQARASLAMAVQRLDASDTFNVIEFNSTMSMLFDAPRSANSDNMHRALTWVEGLEAGGGTEMLSALRAALYGASNDPGRLNQVIFLTDGAIGNERALFETIAQDRGEARIFTVGIGSAPNSFFMSRAAELGRGTFTHIGSVSEVAERMGALFAKLETPAITDISLTWPDGAIVDTSFTLIPDVYQGETLSIAVKTDINMGDVRLTGTSGGQPWEVTLDLDQANPRSGISKLWARKKITALELDRIRQTISTEVVDAAILNIALDHHLISRLTSLIAVDITPTRPEDSDLVSRNLPLDFPEGWDFAKVFGDGVRTVTAHPGASVPASDFTPSQPRSPSGSQDIALPQTATLSDVKLILGGLLLMLAFLMMVNSKKLIR